MKDNNYDWSKRLCQQVKDSFLSSFYEVIEKENFDKDEELNDMSRREDEFERDVKAISDIILAFRPEKERHWFFCLSITDLRDDLISEDSWCSHDKKQHIEGKALNQNRFEESFLYVMDELLDMDELVTKYTKLVKKTLFPYPSYKHKELIEFFDKLRNYAKDDSVKIPNGDKLIKFFHPSIYRTRVEDNLKSAVEAWEDEDLVKKCIKNRMMYKNHLTPEIIRDGFNIAKIAPKPSIFTTAQAIDLFKEYISPDSVIFDADSGFSGKIIAAIILGRKYISPIDTKTFGETSFVTKWFASNLSKEVSVSNITLGTDFKDCDNENTVYVEEITRPYHGVDKSHIEFVDKTITNALTGWKKCKKFIFICKDTEKYKDYVVDVSIKHTHLYTYTTKIIVIERN